MSRIVFLFPGQGSQAVGMGMDIAEQYESARRVFETADRILGFSLTDMIRNGPETDLKQTVNTQPAIVTTSIALLEVLREKGIDCRGTAGHSIGEYSALYCAGVLSLVDCLTLTRARGEYMNSAGEKKPGTLSAIIGLDNEKVGEICHKASEKGIVVVANYNCPSQVVISGEIPGVEEANRLAHEAGASKVIPLTVSAAFHSPLMDDAAEKLAMKLDQVEFRDAEIPVYCNVNGDPQTDGDKIRELMKKQIISQVLWEKSIRRMMSDGFDTFIEIGPGNALSGMMKRIDRRSNSSHCNNLATLEKVMEKLLKTPV